MPTKRKPVTKDNRIVLRIDDELKELAQKAAFQDKKSLSDFLRDLIDKAVREKTKKI